MAHLDLVFQAATAETHARAIRALLSRVGARKVLISVAYVREGGVEAIESALKGVAAQTRLFIGIRNNNTTVQAVKRLLALEAVQLYAVDTATGGAIFHPKLYLIADDHTAGLIVGSANMTFQGLHNNIEASARVALDLGDLEDRNFVDQTFKAFDELVKNHPRHVFVIKDDNHADDLFREGRLEDEDVIPAPTPTSGVGRGTGRDSLPPMNLHRSFRPRIRVSVRRVGNRAAFASKVIPAVRATEYILVWQSNKLSKRDLNLPSGRTTNRTGSMGLKKGVLEEIDHRHFFRDEVFAGLVWTKEVGKPYSELAQGTFELVVKSLNYGKFTLRLRHDTRTNTISYRQHNEMTHLRWGNAIDVVRQPDILGRLMYLYRKEGPPPEFLIKID